MSIDEPSEDPKHRTVKPGETPAEQQETYRLIVDNAYEGIVIVQNEKFCFANKRAAEISGLRPQELLSQGFRRFLDPADRKMVTTFYRRILAGKKVPHTYPFRIIIGHGAQKWVLGSSVKISWKHEPAVLGFFTDISEQKLAEEALRESERRYQNMVENALVGIYTSNLKGDLLYVNKAMAHIFEYQPVRDMIPKNTSAAYKNLADRKTLLEKLKKSGLVENFEFEISTRTGKTKNVVLNAVLHHDTICGMVMDISVQKKAEEELRKAHSQLECRVAERTKELKRQTRHLEEANTALKVLLQKRDEDKKALEEKVLANVKELILPYVEKIKGKVTDQMQLAYLGVLESNLDDIISAFSAKLSSRYFSLTSAEIQVADLVRHGKSTKEISNLLHLSVKTVETHRMNIRKKLGLNRQKTNLHTYLLSMRK
jgi:PAS domain S-box-containing protein